MAKALKKTEEAKKTEETETKKKGPPQPEKPKYGVEDLATIMGINAASVRVRLRGSDEVRKGKFWGWETKAELDAVAKRLMNRGESEVTGAEKEPAKAAKKKKAA